MADQASVDPRGYVKIWRRLMDHPVWNSPNLAAKVLFIHLLMSANWKPGKFICEGKVIEVGPGETVTSLSKLGVKMSVTVKIIRGALVVLKRAQLISVAGTRRYTKISLINWDRWQVREVDEGTTLDGVEGTTEGTTGAQDGHNQGTTRATIKEGKKGRRTTTPSSNGWVGPYFADFWEVVWAKIGKPDAEREYRVQATTPEIAERINRAAKEQAPRLAAEGVARLARGEQGPIHPRTWLHKGRWMDEVSPTLPLYPREIMT